MLAVGLLQAAGYIWAGCDAREDAGFALTQPDTFFYCQAARRIVEGHPFSFSEGTAVSTGTTSVLYPFVLAVPYALGATGDRLLLAGAALNAVFYLVFLFGWSCVIRRKFATDGGRWLASLLLAFFGPTAYVAFDHSDMGLFMAFSALFAAALAADSRRGIFACLIVGPWIRPEGMILDVAYVIVMRRGFVPAALSMGGVFALNFALTGACQFSSVAQKGYFRTLPFVEAIQRSCADTWDAARIYFLGLGYKEKSGSWGWYFPPLLTAALMWTGVAVHRWRSPGARAELVWILAVAGGFATVVTSGWLGTNYDRYLAWTTPTMLLFAAAGGAYLAGRVRVRALAVLPSALLLAFIAISAVVTLAFFHVGAAATDLRRVFMVRCEERLPKGASVGTTCECSAAYALSPRRLACIGGVYSPEFITPLGTASFEILKREPTTRFDYWYEDGGLGGALERADLPALGRTILTNELKQGLIEASWTAFDAGAEMPRVDGLRLVDRVDIAYAPDEARARFEVLGRRRAHVHPFFRLAPGPDGVVRAEGGVFAKEGVAMDVRLTPGRDVTGVLRVFRTGTEERMEGFRVKEKEPPRLTDARLRLEVDGVACGVADCPRGTNAFDDVRFAIPGAHVVRSPCRLSVKGALAVGALWFYQ